MLDFSLQKAPSRGIGTIESEEQMTWDKWRVVAYTGVLFPPLAFSIP